MHDNDSTSVTFIQCWELGAKSSQAWWKVDERGCDSLVGHLYECCTLVWGKHRLLASIKILLKIRVPAYKKFDWVSPRRYQLSNEQSISIPRILPDFLEPFKREIFKIEAKSKRLQWQWKYVDIVIQLIKVSDRDDRGSSKIAKKMIIHIMIGCCMIK